MASTARVTLSLPDSVSDEIENYAEHLGVSKSALVSILLMREVKLLKRSLGDLPDQIPLVMYDSDRRRLSGRSADIIAQEIEDLILRGDA